MRLFVAVRPSPHAVELLVALGGRHVPGERWTKPDQWHVTLRFLGDIDDPAVVTRALASTQLPTAAAVMGPRVKRVRTMLWAPVGGLTELATSVVDATRALGDPPDRRPFRGHITLMRHRPRHDRARPSIAASWTVDEIELVRSHLGPEGARYETLERFALGD